MNKVNFSQQRRPLEPVSGDLVGRVPAEVPSDLLSLNFRKKNPVKAIREKCFDCCSGAKSEIRKCVSTNCPIWPFRLGTNPFRKKTDLSDEEKVRRTARLKR